VINDVTNTIVANAAMLFVIMASITVHFGRNPTNGRSPPKDHSDVIIMNFMDVVCLFVCYYVSVNEGCWKAVYKPL